MKKLFIAILLVGTVGMFQNANGEENDGRRLVQGTIDIISVPKDVTGNYLFFHADNPFFDSELGALVEPSSMNDKKFGQMVCELLGYRSLIGKPKYHDHIDCAPSETSPSCFTLDKDGMPIIKTDRAYYRPKRIANGFRAIGNGFVSIGNGLASFLENCDYCFAHMSYRKRLVGGERALRSLTCAK